VLPSSPPYDTYQQDADPIVISRHLTCWCCRAHEVPRHTDQPLFLPFIQPHLEMLYSILNAVGMHDRKVPLHQPVLWVHF
jgi:hypothetical protein